jgi:hypothetical protein
VERRNSGFFLLIIYLLLAIYLLPVFPDKSSANDLTRWATTVALVENTSFEISGLKNLIGGEFADATVTEDGKVYSNNPPGIALLAAPFYAITRVITGKATKENVRTSWFVMRFLLATLPLFLLAFWLYSREIDAFSLAVLLFATPLFPYSLLFYSHVFVAVLVYLAFRLLFDTNRVFPENCFTAALLLGFAAFCELTAIVPLIIFGIGMNFTEPRERVRRVIFYIAGIAPFIIIYAVYNQLIFGSPLAVLTRYELTYPTLSALYHFLLGPARGLLFFSPILCFAVIRFFTSEYGGNLRHRIKVSTVVLTFLAVIGFAEKYGGDAVGARYLIIVIPLMLDSFFDGEMDNYPSLWRGFLFAVSVLFCTLPMLTYPFAPNALDFPHNSFWQTLLTDANFYALTLLNTFGLTNNIWTILPAMVLLLFVFYFVWRDAKFPVRFAVGLLTGFLLVGCYMFLIELESNKSKPLLERVIKIRTAKTG